MVCFGSVISGDTWQYYLLLSYILIAGQKVMDAAYLVTELHLPDPASTLNFGASGHSHRFI
jgi:hypothetical protein